MSHGSRNIPIIRMYHVSKQYESKNALSDISLEVKENEFLFVTGASGAGKTTLLKLLYFGEPATTGQVIIDGVNLSRIEKEQIPILRRKFGIIFQEYKLISTKTIIENLALVLEVTGQKRKFIEKKVRSVLRIVGMEEKLNTFPKSLSGGEQQRIAVARAVIGDPKIILADEPTGNLDPASAQIIYDLLIRFHQEGATILVATHDERLIRQIKGRIIELEKGLLKADTPEPEIR
ncbi:MAG: cell division ATP-binding protein FtsE [Thermodesulfobacteriota bacterium]